MMKPKTVITKWKVLCKKVKADSTKRKAPGRKEAKKHAAMCGMKSMLEVEIAADLDYRKVPWMYEPHGFSYHSCPNWNGACLVKPQTYTPDFFLPEQDIYLETKGKMTIETRKKMIAVKNHNPGVEIKMVFGYARNKFSKAKNATRYWQWAEKEGFEWSDKEILEEWL